MVNSKPTSQASREGLSAKDRPPTPTVIEAGKPPQLARQDPTSCDADASKNGSLEEDPSGNDDSRNDASRSTTGKEVSQGSVSRSPALVMEHGRIPTAVVMTGGSLNRSNKASIWHIAGLQAGGKLCELHTANTLQ